MRLLPLLIALIALTCADGPTDARTGASPRPPAATREDLLGAWLYGDYRSADYVWYNFTDTVVEEEACLACDTIHYVKYERWSHDRDSVYVEHSFYSNKSMAYALLDSTTLVIEPFKLRKL
jgi:hypothetical protein